MRLILYLKWLVEKIRKTQTTAQNYIYTSATAALADKVKIYACLVLELWLLQYI